MMILAKLKDQTAEQHQRLEAKLDILTRLNSRQDYKSLLEQFYGFYRPLEIEVHWAGDPTKPVEVGDFGKRLTPRKSFALWIEEVKGKSAPWKDCEVDAARALRRS